MERTPQPIVPNVVEPLGQPMLQKAADELQGWQGHGLPALVLGLLRAEADVALLTREHPALGERDPVDVPAQVLQDLLRALHGGCAGDDPPLGPDHLGHCQVGPFLAHQISTQPAKELREGVDRNHGGRAGGPPLAPVGGDPTGRDQAVHVRMVGEGAGPGMPHPQDPDEPPDIMRVRGELDERLGRGLEQDAVEVLLMMADDLPQRVGHREDEVEGWDRQQFLTPLCQPGFGLVVVALGATAVAAGVIHLVFLTTVIARQELPAQGLSPAGEEILHGPAMARQEVRPKPLQVLASIASKHVRHLRHGHAPVRSEIGHEGVDGGVHDVQGR
jgi:hypothetical protein